MEHIQYNSKINGVIFRFGEQPTNTNPSKESGARGGIGNSNIHQHGNKKETMTGCQSSEIGGKINEVLSNSSITRNNLSREKS